MFSFLPQILIIVSLAGIIVILLRKIPEGPTARWRFFMTKSGEMTKKLGAKLWRFILEVKEVSRIKSLPRLPHWPHLPKTFPKIRFPTPRLPFFKSTDSPEFFLDQAQESLAKEDYADAERKFIKAIEKDPKNETAFAGLGKIYIFQKKFDEAIETYKFLTKHHPENDTYFANLGQAYHGQKLYDQAIETYEKAIELDPQNAKRYINLGLTLEAKKHLEEAILNYRIAVDLVKSDTQFMLVLAEALVKKGEKEEAELLLEQILQLEPTNHLAREKLMQLKF